MHADWQTDRKVLTGAAEGNEDTPTGNNIMSSFKIFQISYRGSCITE